MNLCFNLHNSILSVCRKYFVYLELCRPFTITFLISSLLITAISGLKIRIYLYKNSDIRKISVPKIYSRKHRVFAWVWRMSRRKGRNGCGKTFYLLSTFGVPCSKPGVLHSSSHLALTALWSRCIMPILRITNQVFKYLINLVELF